MRCEVCGRRIQGKPNRVIIEQAKLSVCHECAKLGTGTWEEPKVRTPPTHFRTGTTAVTLKTRPKKAQAPVLDSTQLIDDFDAKIRRAREKLGITHEELGKRLNEKVSLLRKIEATKMRPDNKLAVKLEHALKIKLIVPVSEEKSSDAATPKLVSRELTLGDLIKLEKKGDDKPKQEKTERKPS